MYHVLFPICNVRFALQIILPQEGHRYNIGEDNGKDLLLVIMIIIGGP
jgi:hypothetical protein